MIDNSTKQAIKDAANIVDVVSLVIDLKKSGSRLVGLCPFHDEKTPSFNVTPSKGLFHCFGCDVGGDSIDFIMKHFNKSFPEALEYLAGMYKIPIDTTGNSPKNWTPPPRQSAPPPPQPSYYSKAAFRESLNSYKNNNFAKFLIFKFGAEIAAVLIGRYFVGTSRHWPGANVFWQVDFSGKVRGGKLMMYNPETGKRDRNQQPTWMHKIDKLSDYNLAQCFFGEHLLSKDSGNPVAIVESEKTAILASAYLPGITWLAACGKGLQNEKFKALEGRKITLWPDAGNPDANGKTPFTLWSDRAAELRKQGFQVAVSELIETKATDLQREKGFDLADYLLRYELAEFQAQAAPPEAPPPSPSRLEIEAPIVMENKGLALIFNGTSYYGEAEQAAWDIIHARTLARPGLAEEIERQKQLSHN